MNKSFEEAILAGHILPPPRSLTVTSEEIYKLTSQSHICVACPDPKAPSLVTTWAESFWKIIPNVKHEPTAATPSPPEAYAICVCTDTLRIAAPTLQGIRYAMQTLRQLAEPERCTQQLTGTWIIPCLELNDAPDIPFRGLHICVFPNGETSHLEVERQIRIAAALKYNHVILEFWGSLVFPSHPEFCYPEKALTADDVRHLVALAKSLGLTPIPQLNIFGHASAARISSGKHALLDFHPEFAPLFEPDGWCWCLSNPATREFLSDLILDLLDLFENPPYVHLGCDEAEHPQTCLTCRRTSFQDLLRNHILFFGELVQKQGARPMIWHDMFVPREDPSFDGYIHNGNADTVAILDSIPKNFILCDWRYDYTQEDRDNGGPTWKTLHYFLDRGFDTIGCPWYDYDNTFAYGKALLQTHAFGILETTWHHPGGAYYVHGAWAGWIPEGTPPRNGNVLTVYNTLVRLINQDCGAKTYEDFGTFRNQSVGHYLHD